MNVDHSSSDMQNQGIGLNAVSDSSLGMQGQDTELGAVALSNPGKTPASSWTVPARSGHLAAGGSVCFAKCSSVTTAVLYR